ncbi:hypothetical protein CsNV_010 [Callinectes sapidus nudivirus]|nr:hypothetical protein CsNV_010 [Callinectes sapidus nudivirus]
MTSKRALSDDEMTPESKNQKLHSSPSKNSNMTIDEVFSNYKNAAENSPTKEIEEEEDDFRNSGYISKEEFKMARLNVITAPISVNIKATIKDLIDHMNSILNGKKLHEILKDKSETVKYEILHSILADHFASTLVQEPEIMKILMFVLNSLVIFKSALPLSTFKEKISGLISAQDQTEDVGTWRMAFQNYLSRFTNEQSATPVIDENNDDSDHFKDLSKELECVQQIFKMCNNVSKLATVNNIQFKRLMHTTVESRNSDKTKMNKQAIRVILQNPAILRISSYTISDGNVLIGTDQATAEKLVELVKKCIYFKRANKNDRIDPTIFSTVNVGEFREIKTINMYENGTASIHSNFNKKTMPTDTYIIIDSLNIIYNETATKFGLSIKLWPTKIMQKDLYGKSTPVHFIDFSAPDGTLMFYKN